MKKNQKKRNQMKTFKQIIKEARPQDFVVPKDDDSEAMSLTPRSKGEKDFADKHVIQPTDHPVAANNQFRSTAEDDESDHKGGQGPHNDGEQQMPKQGSSSLKKYMAANQTPLRRGDKRQGDIKQAPMKEDLEENVAKTLMNITKSKKNSEVKFKNGKTMDVDPKTAEAIVKVMKDLNPTNKKKMEKSLESGPSSFMKMVDFAMM